jgi:prepilin-type N-terminal cleavage/methylation domain-containing protein
MQQRRGFTLMELMVVIGIIMILAAISLPIITMVRKQAKDAVCRNNLQQIGIGITGFQQVNNNKFPATFASLFVSGGVMEGESPKLLLCPIDAQKGRDTLTGRPSAWNTPLPELYQQDCSYLFEAADVAMGTMAQDWDFQDGTKWGANGRVTWADAKVYALKHDNTNNKPFRLSDFPIVRCFWHAKWPTNYNSTAEKRVLNLAWDMSLFWSIPKWEDQMRGN